MSARQAHWHAGAPRLHRSERLQPFPVGATARTMSAAGATARRGRSAARRRATYQDVLDAPPHRVTEIVDGTLYTHPRPAPRQAVAKSCLGGELGAPFWKGRGGRAGGGSSTSRNCTSARTSWSLTSRGGAGSGCPIYPTRRTSPSRRTGYARCCRPRRAGSICTASARCMPAKGSNTCGSRNRPTAPSKRSSSGRGSGC